VWTAGSEVFVDVLDTLRVLALFQVIPTCPWLCALFEFLAAWAGLVVTIEYSFAIGVVDGFHYRTL
jgi:hypothetical protein